MTDWLELNANLPKTAYDEARWRKVDREIATARRHGLYVILDLSTYRNLLILHKVNPYTHDWYPFLAFVANRKNTSNGIRYGSDSTVAIVSFAGEIDPINAANNNVQVEGQEVTAFFRRVFGDQQYLERDSKRRSPTAASQAAGNGQCLDLQSPPLGRYTRHE